MHVIAYDNWKPTTLNGRPTFSVKCDCGETIILDAHTVTPDGLVSPAVECTARSCGFNQLVRLQGFKSCDMSSP